MAQGDASSPWGTTQRAHPGKRRQADPAGSGGCPIQGSTGHPLFILPGYTFRAVDAMITYFHLPKSSLIMLVRCLCPGGIGILNA